MIRLWLRSAIDAKAEPRAQSATRKSARFLERQKSASVALRFLQQALEHLVMRRLALVVAFLCVPGLVSAASKRSAEKFEQSLKRLDPSERILQVCSLAATQRIAGDKKTFRPDRAVMDSVSSPQEIGDKISGTGGAFRSRGVWYQFSYSCATSPDRLKVLAFEFQVGDKIPASKWSCLGSGSNLKAQPPWE